MQSMIDRLTWSRRNDSSIQLIKQNCTVHRSSSRPSRWTAVVIDGIRAHALMMDSPEKGGSVIRESRLESWRWPSCQCQGSTAKIFERCSKIQSSATQGPKTRQGQQKFPGIPEWPSRPLRISCIARGGYFMAFISHTEWSLSDFKVQNSGKPLSNLEPLIGAYCFDRKIFWYLRGQRPRGTNWQIFDPIGVLEEIRV